LVREVPVLELEMVLEVQEVWVQGVSEVEGVRVWVPAAWEAPHKV